MRMRVPDVAPAAWTQEAGCSSHGQRASIQHTTTMSASRELPAAASLAGLPAVLAGKILRVPLLEIEGDIERPAQARILEFFAANVEGECLHHSAAAHRKFFDDDALVAHSGKIIGRRPILGAVLG